MKTLWLLHSFTLNKLYPEWLRHHPVGFFGWVASIPTVQYSIFLLTHCRFVLYSVCVFVFISFAHDNFRKTQRIDFKLGRVVGLKNISDEFENGLCRWISKSLFADISASAQEADVIGCWKCDVEIWIDIQSRTLFDGI